MKLYTCVYWLLQWTWGIIQNIAGLFLFLLNIRREHRFFHGAVVTIWNNPGYSTGLGMFIFMSEKLPGDAEQGEFARTCVHEYGHTVQSIILGPLFLLVIGLPSMLWAVIPVFKRYRREKRVSYYSFYPECWANYLGERVTKCPSMGQA